MGQARNVSYGDQHSSEFTADNFGDLEFAGDSNTLGSSWIWENIQAEERTTFLQDALSNEDRCQCGGEQLHDSSVATSDHFDSPVVSQWDSAEYPTDAFGELAFAGAGNRRTPFLRLSCDTPGSLVYDLMTMKCELSAPNLVVSVVGGVGKKKMKSWVQEVLRQGLVRAAQSAGAWIMTSGLREGVSRCVGEAVRDHVAAASSTSQSEVVALGVAPWSLVSHWQLLIDKKGSFPVRYYKSQNSCELDINYQAFLLVDDGSTGRQGGETNFITNLEYHISHQCTSIWGSNINIPVLCMLISGDASVLKRMDMSLQKTIPWLVLDGSGPAADLISELLRAPSLERGSHDSSTARCEIKEIIKKHFPTEKALDKLVEHIFSICQYRSLITVFNKDRGGADDFDTVILKALFRARVACKQVSSKASEYTEELKLAVAWNSVDIAKSELFNGDIQWKNEDLQDSMTDALLNNKPQFVRLFTENGLNISEYLTDERLRSLYKSLPKNTVAYTLPQKCPNERHGFNPASPNRFCLFEHVSKLLQGDCTDYKQECAFPWASLLIWAVLQNRSEMAIFFWEMAGESVLSALSARKILRELSKLENETETKRSMKELAQTFETLAHGVFSACYQSSESRSYTLLIRTSDMWGGATCLQMAVAANARVFFSHDGVQTLLSQIWWGDMNSRTGIWKLVISFLMPPLVFKLIRFRDEDSKREDGHNVGKQPKALRDTTNMEMDSEDLTHKGPKTCFIARRWRQFWFAPVTTFLSNVLMYFLFLFLFAYVLLFEMKLPPPGGSATFEFLLYFWIFTMICEEIRQFTVASSTSLSQSMRLYIQDTWNKFDLTAIILFCVGLICRMFSGSYEFGRSVLCLDYMVFTLRLIHIFAINKRLGPKIIMVKKMVKDVFFFLFLLGVWLMAYGVANQALLYSYDPRLSWVFRRVFYRPYMHIHGHVPVEEIDVHKRGETPCTANMTLIHEGEEPCPEDGTNWLVLILLAVYLLVTNVLLLNLLIAMFSYTFSKVQEKSDLHWKFQRYNLIVEYHSRPCLAPPFIIFSHLHLFIKRTIRKVSSDKITHFMLDLENSEASRLNTWESVQKENLLSTQSRKLRKSDTERLKSISTKVKHQMAETQKHDSRLRKLESKMEFCSNSLLWIMEGLAQSELIKQTRPPPLHSDAVPTSPSSTS